ncbi:DUF4112 domain-containing protein [Litoribrevibacter euphylliae]|uniref:DUF4112 domain-containing protein n=1 Tax=Litoribrevibacter euphylliae TaxID=1834034 RepID=A0ABV7H9T8_9GAMM
MTDSKDLEKERCIERLKLFSEVMEGKWRIPFTKIRFGVDFLVGLIPIIGDFLTGALSLWLVKESLKFNLPKSVYFRMLINVVIDMVIGSVPIVGDIFDLYYRANRRNLRLILRYLEKSEVFGQKRS